MNIPEIRPEPSGTGGAPRPIRPANDVAPAGSPADPPRRTGDSVQISDEGRARAHEAAYADDVRDATRLSDIRLRIRTGAYDSDAVLRTVAGRILDSGDLDANGPSVGDAR